jgi:hypothetical protein
MNCFTALALIALMQPGAAAPKAMTLFDANGKVIFASPPIGPPRHEEPVAVKPLSNKEFYAALYEMMTGPNRERGGWNLGSYYFHLEHGRGDYYLPAARESWKTKPDWKGFCARGAKGLIKPETEY